MCYHTKMTSDAQKVEKRFKATFEYNYEPKEDINGFEHGYSPIILCAAPDVIKAGQWGLIPNNADSKFSPNMTLNARIAELHDKMSYRDNVQNRCLIIVNGFYEHQSRDRYGNPDPDGKVKVKYLLHELGDTPFSIAGIYCESGGILTYSLCTTEATGRMKEIHNSAQRMPVVLNPVTEMSWLAGAPVEEFIKPGFNLLDKEIKKPGSEQTSLF